MTVIDAGSALTPDARRQLVHDSARRTFTRRVWMSRLFLGALAGALVIAFIPLFSILWSVIGNGAHAISWAFLTTPQKINPTNPNDIGGIANAITGSVLLDGLAFVLALPIAMILAIALHELHARSMRWLRYQFEIMVGHPSILYSIVVYAVIVTPILRHFGYQFSGVAGIVSLAALMVPLMTVTMHDAILDVPLTLKEAALALGARRSRVMWRVILPYARPRMLTGVLLSFSRAVGETAPIVFVIGTQLMTNWNPLSQQTTLPTLTYNYLGSGIPAEQAACWGIALVLIATVLALNLTSRFAVARMGKGRK